LNGGDGTICHNRPVLVVWQYATSHCQTVKKIHSISQLKTCSSVIIWQSVLAGTE